MVTSALARGDEPAGHARDVGQRAEQVGVDADGHDVHAVGVDAVVGGDVGSNEFSDTVTTRGMRWATRVCMLVNDVPAAQRRAACTGVCGVLHLEAAVDGDGVVDGGQHRQARRARWPSRP